MIQRKMIHFVYAANHIMILVYFERFLPVIQLFLLDLTVNSYLDKSTSMKIANMFVKFYQNIFKVYKFLIIIFSIFEISNDCIIYEQRKMCRIFMNNQKSCNWKSYLKVPPVKVCHPQTCNFGIRFKMYRAEIRVKQL